MIRCHYDNETGGVLGFYEESLYKEFPKPNIRVSQSQISNILNNTKQGKVNLQTLQLEEHDHELSELEIEQREKDLARMQLMERVLSRLDAIETFLEQTGFSLDPSIKNLKDKFRGPRT